MSFSDVKLQAHEQQSRRQHRQQLLGLSAYERHKKFINDYVLFYGQPSQPQAQHQATVKTDHDTLRETYRFLRTPQDDAALASWECRMAKKYYDKLFKEYCLADMSRYKEGAIGMRWRVDKEVVAGKGQFICGNKRCDSRMGLASFEVNFAYKEAGETKNALVKLRVCPECAHKLNYKRENKLRKIASRDKSKKRSRDSVDTEGCQQYGKQGTTHGFRGEQGIRDDSAGLSLEETNMMDRASTQEVLTVDDVWLGKPKEVEATKQEEFDQYFEDMFL